MPTLKQKQINCAWQRSSDSMTTVIAEVLKLAARTTPYDDYERTLLDDHVNITVVLREAPSKLRDNLLVSSQQFESNHNKLRAIIQTYLNSNTNWIANHFRSDTKEPDPMEADCMTQGKGKGRGKGRGRGRSRGTGHRQRSKVRSRR